MSEIDAEKYARIYWQYSGWQFITGGPNERRATAAMASALEAYAADHPATLPLMLDTGETVPMTLEVSPIGMPRLIVDGAPVAYISRNKKLVLSCQCPAVLDPEDEFIVICDDDIERIQQPVRDVLESAQKRVAELEADITAVQNKLSIVASDQQDRFDRIVALEAKNSSLMAALESQRAAYETESCKVRNLKTSYREACEDRDKLQAELATLRQPSPVPAEMSDAEFERVVGECYDATRSQYNDVPFQQHSIGFRDITIAFARALHARLPYQVPEGMTMDGLAESFYYGYMKENPRPTRFGELGGVVLQDHIYGINAVLEAMNLHLPMAPRITLNGEFTADELREKLNELEKTQ